MILTAGAYSPITAIAAGPIKWPAIAPSISELMLPTATSRICTGSSLKNRLEIICVSVFILPVPEYSSSLSNTVTSLIFARIRNMICLPGILVS